MDIRVLLIFVSILKTIVSQADIVCPESCSCKQRTNSYKVNCDEVDWTSLSGVIFPDITTQLIISQTDITRITASELSYLTNLEKLNLSHNQISVIEDGVFNSLKNLTKLDLSYNKLTSISDNLLNDNSLLKRLYLSGNRLPNLSEKLVSPLKVLERIDFGGDLLRCDCNLSWIINWVEENGVTIADTRCASPQPLTGQLLSSLHRTDLHCNWPLPAHTFRITPNSPQLLYEGDGIPLECIISQIQNAKFNVYWRRNGRRVVEDLKLRVTQTSDEGYVRVTLNFNRLMSEHGGDWECYAETGTLNSTRKITLKIISSESNFCPHVTMPLAGKGVLNWPRTVPGVRFLLDCPFGDNAQAAYTCNNGKWQNLSTEVCEYKYPFTNLVKEYSLRNDTDPQLLLQYFPTIAKSYIDIVYIARILRKSTLNVAEYSNKNVDITKIIFNVTNLMMNSDPEMLAAAEQKDESCTKMRENLHMLLDHQLKRDRKFDIILPNIVAWAQQIYSTQFQGMTCTALRSGPKASKPYWLAGLHCFESSEKLDVFKMRNQKTDAAIHIPSAVFSSQIHDQVFKLHIITYKSDALFKSTQENNGEFIIPGAVITAIIQNTPVAGLPPDSPIQFALPTSDEFNPPDIKSVYWNEQVKDWRNDGCKVIGTVYQVDRKVSVLSCDHMTSFSLHQKTTVHEEKPSSGSTAEGFVVRGPPIYLGASFLCLCILSIIITYICAYRSITLSSKLKHSLINSCFCLLLLKIIYVIGVKLHNFNIMCQITGMSLHYLSLCTLFWITVISWNLYKKMSKVHRPKTILTEDQRAPLPPNPMLKFYLFSYGVPVIICGITAAVNFDFYRNDDRNDGYCFVRWEPGIPSFYGVVALFILINLVLFICICSHRGRSGHDCSQEITLNPDTQEVISLASKSSLADSEYRPLPQMAGVLLFLILFIMMWASAALSSQMMENSMDVVLSYLYMVLCIILGIFLIVFYCFVRNDARNFWCSSCGDPEQIQLPRSTTNIDVFSHANTKTYTDHADSVSTISGLQPNPLMHLMEYHRNKSMMSRSVVSGDPSVTVAPEDAFTFYNPRQNGAAKRYWDRKRSSRDRMNQSYHSVHDHHLSAAPHPEQYVNKYSSVKCSRRQRISSTNSEPADSRHKTNISTNKIKQTQANKIGSPQSAFNQYNYPDRWQSSMPKDYRHVVNSEHPESQALLQPYLQHSGYNKKPPSKSTADIEERYQTPVRSKPIREQDDSVTQTSQRPPNPPRSQSRNSVFSQQSHISGKSNLSKRSAPDVRSKIKREGQPLLTLPPPPDDDCLSEDDTRSEKLNINHSSSDNNSNHYACTGVLVNNENKVCNAGDNSLHDESLPDSLLLPDNEERIYENARAIISPEPPRYENLEVLRQRAASRNTISRIATPVSPTFGYELPVYENLFSMNEYDTLRKQKNSKSKSVSSNSNVELVERDSCL